MTGRAKTSWVTDTLLFALLAAALLYGGVRVVLFVFPDEKTQYFGCGYYCAIYNGLATWIWKRLRARIEKRTPA
jgi:hypothetical protein